MSNEIWKNKYLKYKTKYLELLNGGNLVFHKSIDNKYHLQKIDTKTGIFTSLPSDATKFQLDERNAIEDFVNIILPKVVMNGEPLSPSVSEQIKVMNAGTYGITIYYNDLIIKIITLHGDEIRSTAKELFILKYLSDGLSLSVADIQSDKQYINPLLGFTTTNKLLLTEIEKIFTRYGLELNTFTVPTTKYVASKPTKNSILVIPQDITIQTNTQTSDNLLFMFLKKGIRDAMTHFEDKSTNVRQTLPLFINNVCAGLRYTHISGFIHNDIKPENIIFTTSPAPCFQLIDFGLSISHSFASHAPVADGSGSPYMYVSSQFHEKSYLYDWHCLFISILQVIGAMRIGDTCSLFVDVDKSKPTKLNENDLNKCLHLKYIGYIRPFIIQTLQYFGMTDIKTFNTVIVLAHAQECHVSFFDLLKPVDIELFDDTGKLHSHIVTSEKSYENLLFEVLGKKKDSPSTPMIRKPPIKTFFDDYPK